MISKKPFLLVISIVLLLMSCSDDEPRDFRLSLEGEYEVDQLDNTVTPDGGSEIPVNDLDVDPDIILSLDASLEDDEMAIELEEFLEDLFEETNAELGNIVSASVEFDDVDDLVTQVTTNSFELNDLGFEVELTMSGSPTLLRICEMDISGEIMNNEMTFEFHIDIVLDENGNEVAFDGEGSATK
jgi:hypothetical protein